VNSAAEWIAQLPDQISAREAIPFIDQALADAREATAAVRDKFSGTLPPPPWPQHPELVTVIDALTGGRTFLAGVVASGRGDVKQPRDGDIGKRLQIAGRTLYAEVAKMQQRAAALPAAASAADFAAQAAAAAARRVVGTSWGGLLVLAGVVWLAYKFDADA
jgi:hypothetical protein